MLSRMTPVPPADVCSRSIAIVGCSENLAPRARMTASLTCEAVEAANLALKMLCAIKGIRMWTI